MAALFLTALLTLIGFVATGVLADSGLRWWSAFGQLRREMAREMLVGATPALPVQRASADYQCFNRAPSQGRRLRPTVSRAAA